jgi:hypothetical protein
MLHWWKSLNAIFGNLPRPREKDSGAGPTYNRLNRGKEGEKVSEGFKVAMNWGNSRGAKGPSCCVIPLAMMGGRGV